MEENTANTSTPQINPGYGLFQIAKALTTSGQHPDPATRVRALQKIEKWTKVLNGIFSGQLGVGSRTPVASKPGWVTLEVATGGFATGNALAGGPLLDHERAMLTQMPAAPDADARRLLNGYHLTDKGLAALQDRLRSGCYEVAIPEEAALLVVAWLAQQGHADEARMLLETLSPHFPELRFYPILAERPGQFGSQVFVENVGETIDRLKSIKPNQQILAQKEAIQVWVPLYDRMAAIFLETVEGEPPFLRRGADGQRVTPATNGRFAIEGGWPCKHYPNGWQVRAQELMNEVDDKRSRHTLCRRLERRKDPLSQLRDYLRRCVVDPRSLSGRDVGRIRLILAGYIDKRGTPDSSECRVLREKQSAPVSAPTFHQVSTVVIPRLAAYPKGAGLDDLQVVTQPVTSDEAARWNITAGTPVPVSLEKKIQRCLCDSVEALVARGVITSAEVLARVLPQITSGLRAAAISDPALRQLYAATYRAFRRRRSLLLLNLQSQIRIEELPWVAAIDRFRQETPSTCELARQTLQEVATLTLCSFPHMITPNKLVKELRALAKGAELDLPLVDELAADIFMGEFSGKFLKAAKVAASLLEDTLYATYYGIDYRFVRQIPEATSPKKSRFAGTTIDLFAQLCSTMAGVTREGWDTAINGMIIEQQQIVTTQNLAVLCNGLKLHNVLGDRLYDLAQRCFVWICRRQQMKVTLWHARLIVLKNTAYAWRQMVFFLSLLPAARIQEFIAWASDHLKEQTEEYQNRFRPALLGLAFAADGRRPDDAEAHEQGARRFLGWSKQPHWLLGQ